MNTMTAGAKRAAANSAVTIARPIKLAHVVLRTSRFKEMIKWYENALGAWAAFQNETVAFLTYDDEHHRIAFVNVPGLAPQNSGSAGVHHIAFTYAGLTDLLSTHDRLKSGGVEPILCINHGPGTSIYYKDPDGNQLEFQVDNFETNEENDAFFASEDFAINPVGVDFDPAEMRRRLEAGEPERVLKQRPKSGPRGLDSAPP